MKRAKQPAGSHHKRKSQAKEIWRRMKRNRLAMVGLVMIIVLLLMAIFADVLADEDLALSRSPDRLQGPSAAHWFGTDNLGRDVFARIVHGSRISLTLGIATTALSLIIGGLIGAISGYFGGIVDNIIMRVADMFMAIPGILLTLAMVAALGTSMVNLIIATTISGVPGFVRIIRSYILTVIGQEYIEAAKACGMGDFMIILRHILPNVIGPIVVEATMTVAGMIISISGLSYLGMGVQPPTPEWGAMLSEANDHMIKYPHLVIFPGLFIVLSALSLNLLGDGLRDAIDPRLKD